MVASSKFLPVMADVPDAQNCWAPEIFFDEDNGRYLIFWSTTTVREPDNAHRIYYVETRDFTTYTPAKVLYDGGFSVIDAFIVKPVPGRFVMVMKDETALPTPTKHLRVAEAARADGPYGAASAPISVDWVEGPSVLKRGRDWTDLLRRVHAPEVRRAPVDRPDAPGRRVKDLVFPRGVRHGTAFAVSGGHRGAPRRALDRGDRRALAADARRHRVAGRRRSRPGRGPTTITSRCPGCGSARSSSTARTATAGLMLWRRVRLADAADDSEQHRREPAAGFRTAGRARAAIDGEAGSEERLQSAAIDGSWADTLAETQAPGVLISHHLSVARPGRGRSSSIAVTNQTRRGDRGHVTPRKVARAQHRCRARR